MRLLATLLIFACPIGCASSKPVPTSAVRSGLPHCPYSIAAAVRDTCPQSESDGVLEGYAGDRSTGKPLPNVTVTTTSPAGVVQGAITDSAGRFLFCRLPPGDYRVDFSYQTIALHWPGVPIRPGLMQKLNAVVEPDPLAPAPRAPPTTGDIVPGTLSTGDFKPIPTAPQRISLCQ